MANDDGREVAANIFDRTAKLAGGLATSVPAPASAALLVAAGISAAIAGLLRSLGVDGAKEAIDELVKDRDKGRIAPADVAADDATIANAVSDLYDDDGRGDIAVEDKPKRKRSSSRRKAKKATE